MKNFKIEMLWPIPRMKVGEDFKLNKDTAKRLYFVERCNLGFVDEEIVKWYEENFDKAVILSFLVFFGRVLV